MRLRSRAHSRRRVSRLLTACCAAVAAALGVVAIAQGSQPMLRIGTRGPLVADWQRVANGWLEASSYRATRRLRQQLGGGLVIDGVFGPRTNAVTRRFQQEAHLKPTGVVDLRTWERWIGASVTCCGAGLPSFRGPFGTRPDAYVAWWQLALDRWLAQRRLPGLVIDGVYGNITRSKTALFQSRTGLGATGVADRRTWKRMQHQDDDLRVP
ncbi:MAG: peptidoglycan-binding protein [Actinobacteria bacterium]|nr:MAG: peptidoglycan-binding protein [Actinomycetota bacterium]TML80104.1 MAG: peptidoglycan-binding protein [Actinomycetota bacterium]